MKILTLKNKNCNTKKFMKESGVHKKKELKVKNEQKLLNWFGKETCVNDITTESIRDFKHYLRQKNYSPSTINTVGKCK